MDLIKKRLVDLIDLRMKVVYFNTSWGKIVFAPGVRWTRVEPLRLTPQKRNNIAKSPLSRVIIVSHLKFTLESTADYEV